MKTILDKNTKIKGLISIILLLVFISCKDKPLHYKDFRDDWDLEDLLAPSAKRTIVEQYDPKMVFDKVEPGRSKLSTEYLYDEHENIIERRYLNEMGSFDTKTIITYDDNHSL